MFRVRELPWEDAWGMEALIVRRQAIRDQQARFAARREIWIERNHYYYQHVLGLLKFIIEPGKRVLSVRCETGKYLSGLEASEGVGLEVSDEIVKRAQELHPDLTFLRLDPEEEVTEKEFDYVLVENIHDMSDILAAFQNLSKNCHEGSRVIVLSYNELWRPVFRAAEMFGLKMPRLEPNWLSEHDLNNVLHLTGFESIKTIRSILVPKGIPLIADFLNKYIAPLPIVNLFSMIRVTVARPTLAPTDPSQVTASVIVPCKDEKGNIEAAVKRIPELGKGTEIIFCDDNSTDGTGEEVRRMQQLYPHKNIRLVSGPGINKAKNVWTGYEAATGDILMILDADLTVMPEELPYFFNALVSHKADFVNGVRMVYPMKRDAMNASNLIGNKAFSLAFSFVLGTRIKDTLCGTKVFWRRDWPRIKKNVGTWGIDDHWGDFDLIFGAAKCNLKIIDLPTHYQERTHGETKMSRVFANGLRMARIVAAAYGKFLVR